MAQQIANSKVDSTPTVLHGQVDKRVVLPWPNRVLPFAILLVYALLPTKNYYWDGISFALGIERAGKAPGSWPILIHPNHLVYNLIGYLTWISVRGLGFHVRALPILQGISMVAAAGCVWLVQRTLLRITGSAYISGALSAIFAFSAVFWKFATDADSYVPSVLFLAAAYYVLTTSTRLRPFAVGMLHSGAMLIHQLAVLFFPAAALGIFLRGGWKNLWRYCAVAAGTTLPLYYAGFRLQQRDTSLPAFLRWLTNRSPDASFSFSVMRNLAITVSSYVRLFLGGTGRALQFFGPFMLVTLILLAGVLAVLCVILVRYRADVHSNREPDRSHSSHHPWIPAVWFAAYFVFLFFWLPQNTFYKLFCLPAILFLFGESLAKYRGPRRNRLVLLAAAMALANLALYIFPYSRPDYNQSLRFAMRMRPLWSERTVVYYRIFTVDDWFICYFNPETVWKLTSTNSVDALADAADSDARSGRDVWIDTTAAEMIAADSAAMGHFSDAQEDNFPKHPIRFLRWAPH